MLGQGPILLPPTVYTVRDTPVFAKAGSALPTRDMNSAYSAVADPLIWEVVPGATGGTGTVYEDDGVTVGHRYGEGATTTFVHSSEIGSDNAEGSWSAMISAAEGNFTGMPGARTQRVVLKGHVTRPASASCDGQALAWLADPPTNPHATGIWLEPDARPVVHPGAAASLVVSCGKLSTTDAHRVVLSF